MFDFWTQNSFGNESKPIVATNDDATVGDGGDAAAAAASSVFVSEAGVRGVTANLQNLQLMRILGIDPELSDCSNKGLKWCYKKYKAFNAAVQTMDEMFKNGKWPLPKKPNHTELVEIFLSKSF